jgi:3D (Asp-Asp-Asp) domain-containing protein
MRLMVRVAFCAVLALGTFFLTTSAVTAPAPETFTATAYTLRGKTASGTLVALGTVAADPRVLPMGTQIRVDASGTSHDGVYIVRDTGVRGRHIDIWMSSSARARAFGRQKVLVTRIR